MKNLTTAFVKEVDKNWWLRHGLFWLFYFLFLLNLSLEIWHFSLLSFLRITAFGLPQDMICIYIFLYAVLPQLKKRKIRQGLSILFLWIVGCYFLIQLDKYLQIISVFYFPDEMRNIDRKMYMEKIDGFTTTISIAFVVGCIKLFREWYKKEQENNQLIEENLGIELQLLKSQIHPHFLFNTLNNLYALTLKQSDKATEIVQRLSGLLKYIVEDCTVPQVRLSQEINLLKNYISLEQLRYGDRLNLLYGEGLSNYFENESELEDIKIAPLLFLPFVENAFKHGSAEQLENSFIFIELTLRDNHLIFTVKNSKNPEIQPENYIGGIGLKNVKKRLQLIYRDSYELIVSPKENSYSVQLTLKIIEKVKKQNIKTLEPTFAV